MKSKSNPHSCSAGLKTALVFLNRAFELLSCNNLQFHGVFVAFRAQDGLQLTISRFMGENKPAWRDHDLIPHAAIITAVLCSSVSACRGDPHQQARSLPVNN